MRCALAAFTMMLTACNVVLPLEPPHGDGPPSLDSAGPETQPDGPKVDTPWPSTDLPAPDRGPLAPKWTEVGDPAMGDLRDVWGPALASVLAAGDLYAAGPNGMWRRVAGKWQSWFGPPAGLNAVAGVEGPTALAAVGDKGFICEWYDPTAGWGCSNLFAPGQDLNAVAVFNGATEQTVVVGGGDGTQPLLMRKNVGDTLWVKTFIGGGGTIRALWQADATTTWYVSGSGVASIDETYVATSSFSSSSLWSIFGVGTTVYVGGENGEIKRIASQTATSMTSNTTATIRDIWGRGPNDLFAVGSGGTILRYDGNAALTWTAEDSGTTGDLRAVWGRNNTVYAVGGGGTVLERVLP